MASSTSSQPAPNSAAPGASRSNRRIALWLFFMCGLVAAMVIVGGATRLTDSGLSIVEWRPVTGAIPPMSEADWLSEFEKYKTIPEYAQVNFGMSLAEFKRIYWWEWGHRLLGRIIGFAFLLPLIFFAATKQLTRDLSVKLGGLFVLGGMQGALGWWMVTSGFADRIDVSQYRLAAHLSLAVLLFAAMFWLALDLWPQKKIGVSKNLQLGAMALAAGVFLQMVLGAFVAGLRAGRTFNTWPLMDGKFFPDGYFNTPATFHDLFETMAAVQFNHRIGAYLLAAGAVWFYLAARKGAYKHRAHLILAALGVQILLGIWTVIAATPIALGLLHQAGALIVFATALYAAHGAKRAESPPENSIKCVHA
ncbi:COX15/CtaA family protein [Hyphococcus luteus]|uniref:Heme A synthase n=1 Tax=Hyphococcus luteus TaxID=2058213 RepID=A0A2S7JZ46_9PROT|nr:COX15/CtaA family protein [Marinicaulis flavus]PQA85523.1 heme A synthase [Marinicaulis flavus]